jgi:hypothetical protein
MYVFNARVTKGGGKMYSQIEQDLEKLETLREQALFGPEEKRREAERAYQELREKLFDNRECQTPD